MSDTNTVSETQEWSPPTTITELYEATAGNKFASMNRPTAGPRDDLPVQVGKAPFQLYSLATPNGQKVGIMLEELGIDYDAWYVSIGKGEQFSKGFVDINPNSKIPCAVDNDANTGIPVKLFETGSIVLYLAEKYNKFIPKDPMLRAQCMNWVFWQMGGQGPMTGNYGHFMVYAPKDQIQARNYGAARYGMETQRLCSVLDQHLAGREYIVGDEYTIADIMCFPWVQQLRTGYIHKASKISANNFLNMAQYENLAKWADKLMARPQVQRGLQVCSKGKGKPWLEPSL